MFSSYLKYSFSFLILISLQTAAIFRQSKDWNVIKDSVQNGMTFKQFNKYAINLSSKEEYESLEKSGVNVNRFLEIGVNQSYYLIEDTKNSYTVNLL